jgi:hypothetical protein
MQAFVGSQFSLEQRCPISGSLPPPSGVASALARDAAVRPASELPAFQAALVVRVPPAPLGVAPATRASDCATIVGYIIVGMYVA